MRLLPPVFGLLAILLIAPSPTPASPSSQDIDPFAEIRGMTISCPGAGLEWGSEEMVSTLGKLADLGVNWVAIHPYGGIRHDGTVGRSRIDRLYEDPYWLTRAIEEAHAKNLKILIKPHLAYWGTRFSWRGAIEFETDEEWSRFFATYHEWIVRVARLSTDADAFAIGTEMDRTMGFESEWRSIIAGVREAIEVPLTYSASWNEYQEVPFWDALDAIAVQAYFPLVDHDGPPTDAELIAGWTDIVQELEAYGREQRRTVVLGELGYNRSLEAAVHPWKYSQHDSPEAEELQVRCLDTALTTIAQSPGIAGAFLWKWFPGEYPRGNFLKSTPAMRGVIGRHWGGRRP